MKFEYASGATPLDPDETKGKAQYENNISML